MTSTQGAPNGVGPDRPRFALVGRWRPFVTVTSTGLLVWTGLVVATGFDLGPVGLVVFAAVVLSVWGTLARCLVLLGRSAYRSPLLGWPTLRLEADAVGVAVRGSWVVVRSGSQTVMVMGRNRESVLRQADEAVRELTAFLHPSSRATGGTPTDRFLGG